MSAAEPGVGPGGALVALDFTGSELRLLLATPDQQPIASERWLLPELEDEEAWSWEIGGRLATLFAGRDDASFALGIAIACPGLVDPVRGVLTESRGQAGWDDLHVVDAVRRHIDRPVVAVDRVQAALRGEATTGDAWGQNDVLYLSARDGETTAAVLAAGRAVTGAHHRPGLVPESWGPDGLDSGFVADWIAGAAALLDSAVVVLDAAPDDAQQLLELTTEALVQSGAAAAVLVSKLGERAPLLGALSLARVAAYEAADGSGVEDS